MASVHRSAGSITNVACHWRPLRASLQVRRGRRPAIGQPSGPAKLARPRAACSGGAAAAARTIFAALLIVYVLSAFFFLGLRPLAWDSSAGSLVGPAAVFFSGPPPKLQFRLVASVPSNAAQAAVSLPQPRPAATQAPARPQFFAVLNYYGASELFSFRPPLPTVGSRDSDDGNDDGAAKAAGRSAAGGFSPSSVERVGELPGSASHGGVAFQLGGRSFLAVAQFGGGELTVFEVLAAADPKAGAAAAAAAAPALCLAAAAPAPGVTSVAVLSLPQLPAGTVRLAATLYNDGRVAFFDVSLAPPREREAAAPPAGGGVAACPSPVAVKRLPAETHDLPVPGAVSAVLCSAHPPRASPRRVAAGAGDGPALTLLTVVAYFAAGGWEATSVVFQWDAGKRLFRRMQEIPTTGAHGAACFRTKRGATGLALALARDAEGGFVARSPVFWLDWRAKKFAQVVRAVWCACCVYPDATRKTKRVQRDYTRRERVGARTDLSISCWYNQRRGRWRPRGRTPFSSQRAPAGGSGWSSQSTVRATPGAGPTPRPPPAPPPRQRSLGRRLRGGRARGGRRSPRGRGA